MVLTVVLFASLVPAQGKSAKSVNPKDTAQHGISAPSKKATPFYPREKLQSSQERGWAYHPGPDMMQSQYPEAQCDDRGRLHRPMFHPSFCHCRPFYLFRFFFMLWLFIGIVNILLTIIVSLDMARNKRFNGLWIPVLLIAGIPGSAIYALFRIGDKIQSKENA